MLWADPAGTFFYVDRRAGVGSISLRPWAESSYDRPSERRASRVRGPSVDRLEYVISGVTNVTAFLGARDPGQFSWNEDGSRGSTGGRFADTQQREPVDTLSAPPQSSDREFVWGFLMRVQLVGHQVKERASTE